MYNALLCSKLFDHRLIVGFEVADVIGFSSLCCVVELLLHVGEILQKGRAFYVYLQALWRPGRPRQSLGGLGPLGGTQLSILEE